MRIVDRSLKDGFTWVVDADLENYFDTIPKQRLMSLVKASVSDGKVLELLQQFLDQEAEAVLLTIQAWVGEHGLTLHPEKTRVSHCAVKGQGFEFLESPIGDP